MKTGKILLRVIAFLLIGFLAISLSAAWGSDFPTNKELAQRNVAIKLIGFGFTSGLTPTAQGRPNGNGVEIVTQQWVGSGFIVKEDGTLLTNFHVARRALKAQAVFDDGSMFEIPYIKVYDPVNDIAVLQMRANKSFPAAKLGDSDTVEVRDEVLAVGNPLGMGINITEGKISQIVRNEDRKRVSLRHTATIAPGNSGGALYKGQKVVGINVRSTPPYEFYEAIPINIAKPLLEKKYEKKNSFSEVFPADFEMIARKCKQVFARNGQVPPAKGQNTPGVLNIRSDLYPLEDLYIALQAQKGYDLLLVVDDNSGTIGFGDLRETDFDAVLLSNEVNYKKINISVLNYYDKPVNFGLSVSSINW